MLVIFAMIHTECTAGYYKAAAGNGKCSPCPDNSAPSPNQDSCLCKKGFYRAPQDDLNGRCSGKIIANLSCLSIDMHLLSNQTGAFFLSLRRLCSNALSSGWFIALFKFPVMQLTRSKAYHKMFIFTAARSQKPCG